MELFRSSGHRYLYHYGYDCLDQLAGELARLDADRYLVVTDDTVLALHGEALLGRLRSHAPTLALSQPPGESAKSLAVLGSHLEDAIAWGATRRSVVVTFGGGVPGNLGGLMAAMLFRGVRLVHVPTTTMAAMDSTISLKQAVNSSHGKNHLGVYHRPVAIATDLKLLDTLPHRELRSGLCEAIKNCLVIRPQSIPLIHDLVTAGLDGPAAYAWLLTESLQAKLTVMVDDHTEQGAGLVLEYGHTVGHAVELLDRRIRGDRAMSHGEAVSVGMVAAAGVARALDLIGEDDVRAHESLLRAVTAPVRVPTWLPHEELLDLVRHDNKRGYLDPAPDKVPMVLLSGLGAPVHSGHRPLVEVPLSTVDRVLRTLRDDGQSGPEWR